MYAAYFHGEELLAMYVVSFVAVALIAIILLVRGARLMAKRKK
jgi:hypothetical protein